jgi:uncharacterized membrane protein YbaN (DUF454 family)
MQTDTSSPSFENFSTKLIACVVIVACLLLGLAGLVLPLIPGLLLIGVGAVVAAKLSPRFAETLRQNDTLRGYLDKTERMAGLPLAAKLRVVALLIVKALVDGIALLVAGVIKIIRMAERA